MSVQILRHNNVLELNGVPIPFNKITEIKIYLQEVAGLRFKIDKAKAEQQSWIEFCEKQRWSPEKNPVACTYAQSSPEVFNTGKALYSSFMKKELDINETQKVLLSGLKNIPEDYLELQIESLCFEDLQLMLKSLIRPDTVNPKVDYATFLASTDPTVSNIAQRVLWLEEILIEGGIHLRWPSPPLGEAFIDMLQHEIEFQLRWSVQLFEMIGDMSSEEREGNPLPKHPLTEESVTNYVTWHKDHIDERSVWEQLGFNSSLTQKEELILEKQRSWMENSPMGPEWYVPE